MRSPIIYLPPVKGLVIKEMNFGEKWFVHDHDSLKYFIGARYDFEGMNPRFGGGYCIIARLNKDYSKTHYIEKITDDGKTVIFKKDIFRVRELTYDYTTHKFDYRWDNQNKFIFKKETILEVNKQSLLKINYTDKYPPLEGITVGFEGFLP